MLPIPLRPEVGLDRLARMRTQPEPTNHTFAVRRIVLFCLLSASFPPSFTAAQTVQSGDHMTQTIPGTTVSFDLILLPGGSFKVGSPPDEPGRDEDEGPQRTLTIGPFWMGTTEVPHEVFSVFRDRSLDDDIRADPSRPFDADAVTRPSPPYEDPAHGMGGAGRPATGMTRAAALHFARWLSEKTGQLYRLPTEMEWEYACRAGHEDAFGLGAAYQEDLESIASLLSDRAWFEVNSDGSLRDVGTLAPNSWGLYDLLGNAAEWTLHPYDADRYASLDDAPTTRREPDTSTRGRGVVRGGAFDDDLRHLRCADRFEETSAWKRRDPQIPKSRWWNTDSPHVGIRLVSPARPLSGSEITAYWDGILGAN
ncbi:MAG: SUMF1/EgtB/PvdO family nonheme iron enzyme [Gemmatimonadota bacterium]|nr:SUMF1/EgtB/PvdO family nonheme iron enzyme [Gemmatimonadota bacterium]MDE3007119.1 SUMF1/EgtB/PvdO family nonheme iron enzyme [Gemmatimonadota bacterium]